MSDIDDWWNNNLMSYREDGRRGADLGDFNPPHFFTDEDPQYLDENEAYKDGFMERRKELGESFKWN